MAVDLVRAQRAKALEAVRDCQQKAVENEAALWINAAYAYAKGASIGDIAIATGYTKYTVREKLARVRGDG